MVAAKVEFTLATFSVASFSIITEITFYSCKTLNYDDDDDYYYYIYYDSIIVHRI